MIYRKEVDGLRAVAVVPVIAFHAEVPYFSGGYVGVDIFFVLSGFLITSILIEEFSTGRFDILKFYERRARRILPALFFVILCCLPPAWYLLMPSQMKDFAQSIVGVSLFASNILFMRESGYFAPEAELFPLLHTWSLAVEEQYYIFFPVLLALNWRFGSRCVFWLIVVLALFSLALSEWAWRHIPSSNFYLTPTRAWEILAGSLAAFIVHHRGSNSNNALSLLGLAAILTSIFAYNDTIPFPSIFTLLPVGGATLLVLYSSQETFVGRILGNRILVGLGLISYSAYLWHQPIFAFIRIASIEEPGHGVKGAMICLTLFLAAFSWRYIEQPFRGKYATIKTQSGLFIASIAGLAFFVSLGLSGHLNQGFATRFTPLEGFDQQTFVMPSLQNGYCFFSFNRGESLPVGDDAFGCYLGDKDGGTDILLFGDSYAAHWDPFWDEYGKDNNAKVHSITTNWCFPTATQDRTAPAGHTSRLQCTLNTEFLLKNADRYDAIVLAGAWHRVWEEQYQSGVYDLIAKIAESTDAQIIVMDSPPQLIRSTVERAIFTTGAHPEIDTLKNANSLSFWNDLTSRLMNDQRVNLISRSELFDENSGLHLTGDQLPYSLDGGHISIHGALASYKFYSGRLNN